MTGRLLAVLALFLTIGCSVDATSDHVRETARPFQCGVNWVAGPEVSDADFDALVDGSVRWIVQTPFGWQAALDSPEIRLATDGRIYWGERDSGIEETTRIARSRGIRTMLKPHLWIRGGAWPGDIRMESEADWERWFSSYRAFILHYARLAERLHVDVLVIGTELRHAAVDHPERWRSLIAEIRSEYRGELTYAANWHGEYDSITFWDELDFIGLQAYFPLPTEGPATADGLEAAWQRRLREIEAVAHRFDRDVVFTEVGYRSVRDAHIEPWVWTERAAGVPDPTLQEHAYEALLRVASREPWLRGVHLWKWYPDPNRLRRDADFLARDFTPQGKPAEAVMRRWFERLCAE